MKINNISITSHTAIDFELNEVKPITIFRGKHSSIVLDLMREVGSCPRQLRQNEKKTAKNGLFGRSGG